MRMNIVKIKFEGNPKEYSFSFDSNTSIKIGETIIVNTDGVVDYGKASNVLYDTEVEKPDEIISINRVANYDDITKIKNLQYKEKEYFNTFIDLAEKQNISFKPIKSKLSYDEKKVYFYYYSENRVDFRELLKALISELNKKIELRQVDSRENVTISGGLGVCGNVCCCNSFLSNKPKTTLNMAKNQDVPINQDKVTGLCMKPKCCLSYENEIYTIQKKGMPDKGKSIKLQGKNYKVVDLNILKEEIKLREITDEVDEYNNQILNDEVVTLTKDEYLNINKDNNSKNNEGKIIVNLE